MEIEPARRRRPGTCSARSSPPSCSARARPATCCSCRLRAARRGREHRPGVHAAPARQGIGDLLERSACRASVIAATEIVVRMGELAVSAAPATCLVTIGLGSCIGVVARRPHPPRRRARARDAAAGARSQADGLPAAARGKYADLAVPALVDAMLAAGARRLGLQVALVGGAKMFGAGAGSLDVGARNEAAVRDALTAARLRVRVAATGGDKGRTVRADVGIPGRCLCAWPNVPMRSSWKVPMSANKLMSQDRIATLFERAAEGNRPTGDSLTGGGRARWLRTIDFTRPSKFTPRSGEPAAPRARDVLPHRHDEAGRRAPHRDGHRHRRRRPAHLERRARARGAHRDVGHARDRADRHEAAHDDGRAAAALLHRAPARLAVGGRADAPGAHRHRPQARPPRVRRLRRVAVGDVGAARRGGDRAHVDRRARRDRADGRLERADARPPDGGADARDDRADVPAAPARVRAAGLRRLLQARRRGPRDRSRRLRRGARRPRRGRHHRPRGGGRGPHAGPRGPRAEARRRGRARHPGRRADGPARRRRPPAPVRPGRHGRSRAVQIVDSPGAS